MSSELSAAGRIGKSAFGLQCVYNKKKISLKFNKKQITH